MKHTISLIALFAAAPGLAEETRQLDAHEHGVSALNIAFHGRAVAMELHAPGADIVGFEHPAESDEDRAAVLAAMAKLQAPMELFVFPDAAECAVSQSEVTLLGDDLHEDHEDHGHDEHGHDDHGHDDHDHGDHAHEDHHEDHKDEHHDDHAHDEHHDDHGDHDHEDHAQGANHTEFHARYVLSCAHPEELTELSFGYFTQFTNAREIDVQIATEAGASAFEVTRDAATLDLGGVL